MGLFISLSCNLYLDIWRMWENVEESVVSVSVFIGSGLTPFIHQVPQKYHNVWLCMSSGKWKCLPQITKTSNMLKHYQNLCQLPCNDFSAFLEEKKREIWLSLKNLCQALVTMEKNQYYRCHVIFCYHKILNLGSILLCNIKNPGLMYSCEILNPHYR